MSFVYTYSQTSDFPGGLNSSQLVSNINAWPVVGATCLFVNTYGDAVYVNMDVSLTITQKSQLDAAIAAYVYKSNDSFYITTTGTFGTQTILNTTQTTNQTINFPNATDTLVGRATADTLTNKTLTDATDNILARGLWNTSGGGSVSTYASSAPTTGQILKATNNVTATWQTLSAADIGTGTLAVANGGTNLSSYVVGDILFASATTTLGRLADVATGNALISGGVSTAPSWGKIDLTTTVTGTLPILNGGTNLTSYVTGDLLYASATNVLSSLADVATGNALISGGVGVIPSWGKIGLTTHVSGTLPIANGGTNLTTYVTGDIVYASATNVLGRLADVAIGNALISSGVGIAPSWGKIDLTAAITGTLPAANGGTGNATYVIGDILYASGTTTLSRLADVATGSVLLSGGIGVAPSWGQINIGTSISGILPVANGGTGIGLYSPGDILYAGAAQTLTRLAIAASNNVLTTNGGGNNIAWGKVDLTAMVSGTLPAANGGTGNASYIGGDILYASGAATLSRLADVAVGNALSSGGAGNAPFWGKIGLTTHISGILPIANGGTNLSSYTTGDLLYASTTNVLSSLADVAAGNSLISGGVGVIPSWGKIGLTTHISGTLAVGNGGTGTTTLTSGAILQGNGAGAILSTLAAPASALVGVSDSQTLTNKTMSAAANAITCRALGTTGSDVQVSTAAAPSTGQALIATSATSATWQNVTASALTTNYVSSTSFQSIPGSSYTVASGMSFTPSAGTYLIMFNAELLYVNLTGSTTDFAIFVGGVAVSDSTRQVGESATSVTITRTVCISTMTKQVLNGATVVDARINALSNTVSVFYRNLFAFRIA